MGCCLKVLGVGVLFIALGIGYVAKDMCSIPPMPKLSSEEYWGPKGQSKNTDTAIRPFKIEFTDSMVSDLKSRLKNARFSEPLEGINFEYGFNHNELKKIVKFWGEEYNFAERQTFLNSLPHFKTHIQGLDIHFIHAKPKVTKDTKVLPLLLLHGWPGSVVEFYKVIPMLTAKHEGNDFVFEVIAPSLPGFGFSQAASRPGFGIAQIAIVMSNLMKRLGHTQYYIQGGDWGSVIGSALSTLRQDEVLGYHSNMPVVSTKKTFARMLIASFWPTLFMEEEFVHRVYPLSTRLGLMLRETGYFHIQATKPDSIGAALEDSPSGLAAWILEKFSTGTDKKFIQSTDGGLTKKFTLNELIDNLMMYWSTKSATTAGRIYAEYLTKSQRDLGVNSIPTKVPTAIARFPNDITFYTRSQLEDKYLNVVQISDFKNGGHFAALEEPKALVDDVFAAVKKIQDFYRTNKDKK